MVTRIFFTEYSPRLETILGRSWPKVLSVGLGLALAAIIVISLPRLIAGLIALALFAGAGITLATAYNLWQMSRDAEVEVEVPVD